MKLLKKMLLVNWHYFWQEMIEFAEINFLTGRNAAGKSTLIDALQLVLLGDTSGHFFNKAANDKSTRTLKGYLRGEIGDDGDVGFRYLREGRFTSYLACEFHDDLKNKDFTLGVVFDCYEDGTHEHHFFVLDFSIPESRFIANDVPLSFKELRNYLKKKHKASRYEFYETNRRYQDSLKGKLGGLRNKYFSLFKKAVPFTPITDIETFITEYVCDVKNLVDISLMQDNIRYYKRLEHDADLMEERIAALEGITAKYVAWQEENQKLEIQTYVIERAQHQATLDRLAALEKEVEKNREEIACLTAEQEECRTQIVVLDEERKRLEVIRTSSDINRRLTELEKQKNDLAQELEKLQEEVRQTVDNMRKYGLVWRENLRQLQEAGGLEAAQEFCRGRALPADFWAGCSKWEELVGQAVKDVEVLLNIDAKKLCTLGESGLTEIREGVSCLKQMVMGVSHTLSGIGEEAVKKLRILQEQVANLEKGIKPYDSKLLELRAEIALELERKYGRKVEVPILAELLEIRDDRWRNAVEAYLHTQKFYLFVEPEYFLEALQIYERLKFERGFYDWGLVDTGKLVLGEPAPVKGSLAEEVETENRYARLFIDYVLGRLVKCDQVEELRKYERAITDSCMLYQNYVARQLNPVRWQYPYIGRRAIEEQIKAKRMEIGEWEKTREFCQKKVPVYQSIAEREFLNANEAANALQVMKKALVIPEMEAQHRAVLEELGNLDLTWLEKLGAQIGELEIQIKKLEHEERDINNKRVRLETLTEEMEKTKIPAEKKQVEKCQQTIAERFTINWIEEKGEPRFNKELEARASASEVYANFYSQVARTKNQTEKKKEELAAARSDYNRDYKMSHDINLLDNSPYERELGELKDVRLPGYKGQIQDAQGKAYEQFRDDFLAKLKANIDLVKSQITELNAALKESSFGSDRYRFVLNPRPEYRRYYDMITDEMLLDGFNIGSHIFQEKHKDAIEELFKQIINVDADLNADARAELERNIKRFTDYRTYLNFDLVVTDEEERKQRLSRTLHKKSGGETQTPFYISVLASFAQLYRIRQRNEAGNTMRLIIFDEAFSKMDSERIQESVKLLRKFGLQTILSAPPEKIGDIAALVDRNLVVIRQGDSSCVKAFDSRRLMEEEEYGL